MKSKTKLIAKNVSRESSAVWNSLSAQEREFWEGEAEKKKAEHLKKYPHYKYSPRRNGSAKSQRNVDDEVPDYAPYTHVWNAEDGCETGASLHTKVRFVIILFYLI